ncbi:phosphate acetyltransferase [Spiroplasma clarkii]|uniref:Phosphate acetyltransferase n=1 Tax=Spiroplasma clarkii TaxID=2139 RepID=A0A2K8KK52_9MOLU|nr:phosphate acetyltransferase [Spiroplasma clarkii]ATX70571.1 phosphotransacetylase [Spiroplasma clarkii]
MFWIKEIKSELQKSTKKMKLVFPEGKEDKIIEVANRLQTEGLADVAVLFGTEAEIPNNLVAGIKTIAIKNNINQEMLNLLLTIRKGRLEEDEATLLVQKRNYYGAMLVQMGLADAMVCGLNYSTADTLRPALQIIKTHEDYSIASSVFVMTKGEEQYIFTDCALNVDPNSKHLSDIALMAANFAKDLKFTDIEVAMLSYSTVGSGSGPMVDKVSKAVNRLKAHNEPGLLFEGEMQFDCAYDQATRNKKYPKCKFKNAHPDIYVFPDLNAGNIGYKIAQRMGGFEAAGPFILGLKKPVNDLSRGATVEDIYQTSILTIYQALQKEAK